MDELLQELKAAYGDEAQFRNGQKEAIQGILDGKRMLVVQKTGWGKSLVYFLATKLMRKRVQGITLIISPLLALINNQIASAQKLGLCVETINSENKNDWADVNEKLESNQVDALIISPERLANDDFKKYLVSEILRINLFVVDEAHCISDWGHDFRPDYRRIVDIINMLPSNVPVLATTATANDRVINDIRSQLGTDIAVSRGSLMRESLELQIIKADTKEERLAWIADHIEELPNTGLIYCLTIRDCQLVHRWLQEKHIPSRCYYSGVEKDQPETKEEIIRLFMNNEIKALVATVAFGMGFDKPDIGFVIHFQKPGNLVAYYQQIGRAGRGIDRAPAVLLCGKEDDLINQYFIDSAFPTENLMEDVMAALRNRPDPGLKQQDLEKTINMKPARIKACVKYLAVEGALYKENGYYRPSARPWKPDMEKSRKITEIREDELKQINEFTGIRSCYMKHIAEILDDSHAGICGRCSNCLGHPLISPDIKRDTLEETWKFIRDGFNVIQPRKRLPDGVRDADGHNVLPAELLCEPGKVLSNYGDAGWGRLVTDGKYRQNYFNDDLVEAAAKLLEDFVKEHEITWVTNIPSLRRPQLVSGFARRLSERLHLRYVEALEKKPNSVCQKELNTNYLQYENAQNSFEATQPLAGNVLLVDDMVDSRWTFTVCGYKLRKKGNGKVFPFALANSAGRMGDE